LTISASLELARLRPHVTIREHIIDREQGNGVHVNESIEQQIKPWLALTAHETHLQESLFGLEKESLRVAQNGVISQLPHPRSMGAALTHPYITTDYSEALMELITPPLSPASAALEFLRDTHQFVYQHLEKEILWASSMPCIVTGESSIPIAYYGTSNPGVMKSVYRKGLAYRYGKMMQVIAGVHYNFSYSGDFWQRLAEFNNAGRADQDFINQGYFAMIRNIQRYGWIIAYLFGASPAVCRSFIDGPTVGLESFDAYTYYQPYATSLRLGDIGYQNHKEDKSGVKANYDSLSAYVASLRRAINTPYDVYEKIGVKVDGEYRQLNANVLQIENEYYSSVRPKQVTLSREEKALNALNHRGVKYVELRSLDLNVFEPNGICPIQARFLEIFCLFCLLHDSPTIDAREQREIDMNQSTTAHRGREPGLSLSRDGKAITLRQWGSELCEQFQPVAALLDQTHDTQLYSQALSRQRAVIDDAELTPSATILRLMRENQESFHAFSMRKTREHAAFFRQLPDQPERRQQFQALALDSLRQQAELEAGTHITFDDYLANYYRNTAD